MDRRLIAAQNDWTRMRADFAWQVPVRFNIARAACDDWAGHDPGRVALHHLIADGSVDIWTYAHLKDASDRCASVLSAAGIGTGDRIAILLPQHPAVLVTHFAAMKLGAITLPLFTAFGPDALRYRLADSGARAVVTEAAQLDKLMAVRSDLPDLDQIYSIDQAPVMNFWDQIKAASPITVHADTFADDPALMIYTSGTTGPPKGVLHAHRVLLGHLPSIETTHEGFPKPGDMGWTPADWAWIGGLMDMCMPCLYHGVPQLSHRFERFDPERAFDLIDQYALKNLFLPPTAMKLMRATGKGPKSSLRSVSSGGESLASDLINWGKEVLGAPINEIYGQTECNLVCAHTETTMERRPGTMGRAVPGFDVAILGADGQEVASGEMGEIAVRGPNPVMFLKYWNNPEETKQKFSGDWLLTGDLGSMDGDGYVTYRGRADDVITSAGYRIGPSEIENCLTGHPDVVMAAAIGAPDPVRGQVVHAFVTVRGAVNAALPADLIARVRGNIGAHVAPKVVHIVDAMPLTATGKIMRRELRQLYVDGSR